MTVSIIWAETAGGSAISTPIDSGVIDNGDAGTAQDLYVSHDGDNKITSVGFYIRAYSGSGYPASGAGKDADYNELIAWGDLWASAGDGGFEIAQNAAVPVWAIHKTGQGTVSVPISLTTASGVSVAGEIDTDEEAHVKVRMAVPISEDIAGWRFFDQVVLFSYTS